MTKMKYLTYACTFLIATALFAACSTSNENSAQRSATESDGPFLKLVDGKVEIFGLSVEGEGTDEQILHGANIMAAWLDNDEDGKVDNPKVVQAIIDAGRARIGILGRRSWVNDRDMYLPDGVNPWPYDPEADRYDATLEELLHCVTQYGYGGAYPDIFGERAGTVIGAALDIARDSTDHNDGVPASGYGPNAWFHYNDPTCEYGGCQITEYCYWAITSLVGIQKDRCDQIGHEWELCTPELMQKDKAFLALYNNPEYKFPKNMPDGSYRY